jgi:hypothetical protein
VRATSNVLVPLLALIAALGCAGRSTPRDGGPRVDQGRLQNLLRVASRHLQCPLRELEGAEIAERVWEVAGCGVQREYVLVGRGYGRYRGARWTAIVPVAERAASELACPAQGLSITAPTARERAVAGCGRSATYAMVCDAQRCAWVMTAHAGAWAETPSGGAGAVGIVQVSQ